MKESNTIMVAKHEISYDPDRYVNQGETLVETVDITPLPPSPLTNQNPPETDPDTYNEQISQ